MAKCRFNDLREPLLDSLAICRNDKEACESVGLDPSTLYDWMKRCDKGVRKYAGFSEDVKRARRHRPMALLHRLAKEEEWRAWEATLKHAPKVVDRNEYRRKLKAEADYAEAQAAKAKAEAAVAEALANNANDGKLIMVGVDRILEMLHNAGRPDVADVVEQTLVAQEVARLGWRSDILPREGEE